MSDTRYPEDAAWWVRFLRFLNVLDADFNMLSPTRIQAWLTTLGAVVSVDMADLSQRAGQVQAGTSVVYALGAHIVHLFDKRRAKDITR